MKAILAAAQELLEETLVELYFLPGFSWLVIVKMFRGLQPCHLIYALIFNVRDVLNSY